MKLQKTTRALSLIALLITLGSSWKMWSLYGQNMLWGKLPLWFFLGIWGAVFFYLLSQNADRPKQLLKYVLAASTGILLWAAFPPMPLIPLAFVAFLPLIYLENLLGTRPNGKAERFLPYLFLSFTLWNILSTYWVANSALIAGATAILINSFFMSVPWMLWRWTRKKSPGIGLFILPAYWIAFEYLHLHWDLSWPWLTLGHAFALYPSLVQWYEYTGVLGGSLWIWLGNLAVWALLPADKKASDRQTTDGAGKSKAQKFAERRRLELAERRRLELAERLIGHRFPTALLPSLRLALILLLPALISIQKYRHYTERNSLGRQIEVVVVQPNFEPHYEKFYVSQQTQLDTFLRLSKQLLTDSTDYLVFPETSFGDIRDDRIGKESITRQLQQWLELHPQLKLLTGLAVYHLFQPGEERTPYVRSMKNSRGETIYWEAYNAAVQMQAGQKELLIYKKSRLVPGAEFLPYRKLLFFFKPLVDKLGGSIGGYAAQEKRTPFKSKGDNTAIGTQICYESIYGEFSTGYAREGANLLFIMTNDGWWDNTPGHRQHLWFGRLRAIELRRDIARSANTGISAFINQRGDISQATPYGQTAVIKAQLNPNDQLTFYALHGDIIGRLAAFVSLLFLLKALVESFITKKDIT